jgi:hypothetical protein
VSSLASGTLIIVAANFSTAVVSSGLIMSTSSEALTLVMYFYMWRQYDPPTGLSRHCWGSAVECH